MRTWIIQILVLVTLTGLLSGCIFGLFSSSGGYDARPVSIHTVSFFNQRTSSRLSKTNWKGDWVFRRDRLDLIDKELRQSKPDILIIQELLEKSGSPSESDINILSAGALSDYVWDIRTVQDFADTQESQKLGVAFGLSVKKTTIDNERTFWTMGNDGYLMVTEAEVDGDPLLIFNAEMPAVTDNRYLWYSFVMQRIEEILKRTENCRRRVVISGFLPGDIGSIRFREFVENLELVDASLGFCQIASRCYTSTPTNDVFMATEGDAAPSRTDRIFVHKSAILYSSGRTFTNSDPSNRYAKKFGLTRLWPTQRFGWAISSRFSKCSDEDLEQGLEVSLLAP